MTSPLNHILNADEVGPNPDIAQLRALRGSHRRAMDDVLHAPTLEQRDLTETESRTFDAHRIQVQAFGDLIDEQERRANKVDQFRASIGGGGMEGRSNGGDPRFHIGGDHTYRQGSNVSFVRDLVSLSVRSDLRGR